MSYKRAWSLVQAMNGAFREPLVETEKGGAGGGGTTALTSLGRLILRRYREMEADANRAIQSGVADLRQHLRKAGARKKSR